MAVVVCGSPDPLDSMLVCLPFEAIVERRELGETCPTRHGCREHGVGDVRVSWQERSMQIRADAQASEATLSGQQQHAFGMVSIIVAVAERPMPLSQYLVESM